MMFSTNSSYKQKFVKHKERVADDVWEHSEQATLLGMAAQSRKYGSNWCSSVIHIHFTAII
jgi:hypothetical protein